MIARKLVAGLAVLLTTLGAVAPATAATTARRALDPARVEVVSAPPFSPNGDGRRDDARIVFRLRQSADVRVTVLVGADVRMRWSLGLLDAGRHVWTWDGRLRDGSTVRDGSFLVVVHSTRDGNKERAFINVEVLSKARGRLVTTRRTVHPRATTVQDHVQLTFVKEGWDPWYEGVAQAHARLRIRDARGHLAAEQRVGRRYTPQFDWDGRDDEGHPLPAGRYVAHLRTVDEAGNVLGLSRPLRVSDADLVEEVWTVTLPAAAVMPYRSFDGGCNGCSDYCDPVPSERFAGGLSFRPCESIYFFGAARHFAADVPFAKAPIDSYRVGVTGGPSVMDGSATGYLAVGERISVPVPGGDGTTTSEWLPVDLVNQPYLPTLHRPVVWYFSRQDGSYDVASFTIEYRHYVPAS
jgi:flagellar hook assembly protein FlgD